MTRVDENDLISKFISALTIFGERSAALEARVLSELSGMRSDIQQLTQTISAEHNTVSLPSVMEQQRITMVELITQIKPIIASSGVPATTHQPVVQQSAVPVQQPVIQTVPVQQPVVQTVPVQQPVIQTVPVQQPIVPAQQQSMVQKPVVSPVKQQSVDEKPVVPPVQQPVAQKPIVQAQQPTVQQIVPPKVETPVQKATRPAANLFATTPKNSQQETPKQNPITFSFNPSQAGSKTSSITTVTPQKQETKFSFGIGSGSQGPDSQQKSMFGISSNGSQTPVSQQKSLFGISSGGSQAPPAQKISFGVDSGSQAPSAAQQKPLFGGASSSSTTASFASMAVNTSGGASFLSKPGTTTNAFGGDPKNFSFLSNAATNTATDKKQTEGNDNEAPEEFAPDDSQFKRPDIALPELVDLKTGEENEETLFSARCRLYRFLSGSEVKERGTGDMKLLKSKDTGKIRCVMRREQVFKVCANFAVPPNFEIRNTKQGENVLTWTCKDYSDPEDHPDGEQMTLICRFKDNDTAKKFKEAAQSATQ